jgi:glycogen synthase
MKILLSTDTMGGVWDHTVTLARQLDRAGCEVLVAAIGEPREATLAQLPPGVQVFSRRYRLEWMPGAADDVRAAAEWLRELAELSRADVVHLNQLAYSALRFPAPVLVAVHSDVLSWWRGVHGGETPDGFDEYAGWVRAGLRGADAVVTPTAWQAEQVLQSYGVHVDRVVPNGVDVPEAEPGPRTEPLVLSVGRLWDRGKGADVLDEAIGRMEDAAPPVHFLGETEGPNGERFVPRHGRAHGRVERGEVDAWMRRASVYVAPSRYEPFGLAPLEAALHGCPLVLSDIGSFRELWDGCATFFRSGSAESLAEALRRALDDPAHTTALAAAARERALTRYSVDRMCDGYLSLYRDATAAREADATARRGAPRRPPERSPAIADHVGYDLESRLIADSCN